MLDFKEFLIQARRYCFTSGANPAKSLFPNGYDMEYGDGNLTYRSSNIGGLDFNFLEVVSDKNKPIWSLNVRGRVVADGFNGSFLKEALLEIDRDFPYRGPHLFIKGDYVYLSKIDGDLSWFSGIEEVYFHDILIYEGHLQGGSLK